MTAQDTRERLLDAAERCFAEQGYQATSLRELTRAAGVNLAAVHYHFGSKEDLALAVFRRRLGPVNRRRLELLDAAEAADSPSLEAVLDAFLRPAVEFATAHGPTQARLLARIHYGSPRELRLRILAEFDEVIRRFLAALGRVLPHLPPAEVLLRAHFMVGCLLHSIMHLEEMQVMDPACDCRRDPDGFLASLRTFVAAGLLAPAALSLPPKGEARAEP